MKRRIVVAWLGLCLVVANLLVATSLMAAERYTALFADGQRVEEAEVREWVEATSQPKIGGKAIFDAANPARWIIDRQQPPGADAAMFVEFFGGDRIAGDVVSFRPDSGTPYEQLPAHLVVKPISEVQPPDDPQLGEVRVTTEWIRRVVWQRVANEDYRPGTVWLRSGGMLTYRTLRWGDGSLTLLTGDGIKELSFAELGEVHLPKLDPWTCYFDQLAALNPQLKSRLMQLDTTDGSRWTTSTERFQSRHHGDRNRPEQWYQLLQPAWSLDPVWLRYRTVRAWRFFAPTDVPLSNFQPVEVKQASVFGTGWRWRTNQNVQQGLLQSATQEFGWGFGVQASCDLTFEFPEMARAWRVQYGLDRTAGPGGFAKLAFLVGNGQTAGPQPNLQGSQFVGDTGWLTLPTLPSDQRRVTLHADMAHEDRPPGADPFDIRDSVNWYEPEIRLDPALLAAEVSSRVVARLNGLHGWTVSPGDARSLKVANVVDVLNPRDPQYRLVARSADRFFIASRNVKVGPQHRWLSVAVSRFQPETSPTFVQVKLDGRSQGEFEVPLRTSLSDPDPILIPIHEHQGRTVHVELIVFGTDEKSLVDWRGFALTADRPGILTIFEDDPQFATLLNRGAGAVAMDEEKPYSGKASLRVTPDAGDNAQLPGLDATIADQPRLGQYRYVLFAWKQPTGTRLELQFANDGRLGEAIAQQLLGVDRLKGKPARDGRGFRGAADDRGLRHGYAYDAGTQRQSAGSPLRLNGAMPKDWQPLQRDLYGDFGTFNLTGLSLRCLDGEAAWFDHIYLARTPLDMELARTQLVNPQPAPPATDPALLDFATKREDYGRVLAPFTTVFSSMDLVQGVHRLKEHMGQTDVLRTHPNAQDKPAVLRTGLVLPKDRPMAVDLLVSHLPLCDWQLVVKANGEVIHDQLIDGKLTLPQRGFASIQIPLKKFAGQKVYLEILNQSNNWSNEHAFWKRIALVEE